MILFSKFASSAAAGKQTVHGCRSRRFRSGYRDAGANTHTVGEKFRQRGPASTRRRAHFEERKYLCCRPS